MNTHYKLKGTTPVVCEDLLDWAVWFENADRTVAKNKIDGIEISTVFLGMDHNFSGNGRPVLFETMVFGSKRFDGEMWRYETWDDALKGHKDAFHVVFDFVKDVRKQRYSLIAFAKQFGPMVNVSQTMFDYFVEQGIIDFRGCIDGLQVIVDPKRSKRGPLTRSADGLFIDAFKD